MIKRKLVYSSMRLLSKRLSSYTAGLFAVLLLGGCGGYSNEFSYAPKIYFYKEAIAFREVGSGQRMVLQTSPYDCFETYYYSSYGIRGRKERYGEICGQIVRASDEGKFILDHSIRSEARSYSYTADLFFENDDFLVPVDNFEVEYTDAHVLLNGVTYENVWLLLPKEPTGAVIDSIYYKSTHGILKVFTHNGEIWERELE